MKTTYQITETIFGQKIYKVNAQTFNPIQNDNINTMQVFIISIGWLNTYLAPFGTRNQYDTAHLRITNMKLWNSDTAKRCNDEIIETRVIYAHSLLDVRKVYPEAIEYVRIK